MPPHIILPLIIALCLTALLAAFCAEAAEPAAGDFGQPRVIVSPSDDRLPHLAWPKIVKTRDGTLVLGYVAARTRTAGGCPAVSLSHDGGRTFTKPHLLAEFGEGKEYLHSGNLAIGVAGDGAIVVLAMAFNKEVRNTIFGWRSADAGKTWQPVDTSELGPNKTGSVYGNVFSVPGRGLAVCGHYRKPVGAGLWIAFSDDDGKTWQKPQTMTTEQLVEPCFISAGNGRLIGLARSDAARGYLQFVSADNGSTWGGPTLVLSGEKAVHPSPFLILSPSKPNRLLALQSQRTARGEIYLWSANLADNLADLAWRRIGLLASFKGCEDYSYPWMVHLHDNSWFAVFYAGKTNGPSAIYGIEIRIPRDERPGEGEEGR